MGRKGVPVEERAVQESFGVGYDDTERTSERGRVQVEPWVTEDRQGGTYLVSRVLRYRILGRRSRHTSERLLVLSFLLESSF